jgi:hypothetical protein
MLHLELNVLCLLVACHGTARLGEHFLEDGVR